VIEDERYASCVQNRVCQWVGGPVESGLDRPTTDQASASRSLVPGDRPFHTRIASCKSSQSIEREVLSRRG